MILSNEGILRTFNFPNYLDHTWLSVSFNIHEQLYYSGYDRKGVIENLQRLDSNIVLIKISDDFYWSDSMKLSLNEVINVLNRGRIFFKTDPFASIEKISSNELLIKECNKYTVNAEFLSSPYFLLTSCIHGGKSTIGSYYPIDVSYSKGKQSIIFRKSQFNHKSNNKSLNQISLTSKLNSRDELNMILSRKLDITSALGISPIIWKKYKNMRYLKNKVIDFFVILRNGYKNSNQINIPALHELINFQKLEIATGSTMLSTHCNYNA